MLKIAKAFSAFVFVFIFASFINAQTSWIGNYQFDEDGGRNAGGTKIFIAHQIEVRQAGDGLLATLQSNGYQTSVDLVGTIKADGEKLMIYFDSYGENNMFENYEQGDLLWSVRPRGKYEFLRRLQSARNNRRP